MRIAKYCLDPRFRIFTLIRRDFSDAFAQVDAIVCPTSPTLAFKLGERTADPLSMYLADFFPLAANMAGICGISIPCGFATSEGKQLPVGLQILGKAPRRGHYLTRCPRLRAKYRVASSEAGAMKCGSRNTVWIRVPHSAISATLLYPLSSLRLARTDRSV